MEKRFVLFIVLTMLVVVGYNALLVKFGPPRPDPQAVAEKEQQDKEKQDQPQPAQDKDQDLAPGEGPKLQAAPSEPEEKPATGEPEGDKPAAHPHRIVTLGAFTGGTHPLLVTLNSRGASLERIELVARKGNGALRFRDLDNMSGYLGSLSLRAHAPRGCLVEVVPPGTPAAEAQSTNSSAGVGLQVGDVILSLNDKTVADPRALEQELAQLEPGQSVKLNVERQMDGQARPLTYTAKLGERPFQLLSPETLEKGEVRPHPPSMLLSLGDADQPTANASLHNVDWQVTELQGNRPGIEFRYTLTATQATTLGLAGPIEVVKRYRLGSLPNAAQVPDSDAPVLPYHLDFEVEFNNLGQQPQKLSYLLEGTNGLPTEGWWYLAKIHPRMFYTAGARDVVLRTEADGHRLIGCSTIVSRATDEEETSPEMPLFSESEPDENRALSYIGIDTQYFASALLPNAARENELVTFARAEAFVLGDVTKKPKGWERTANVSYRLWSQPITLEPEGTWRQDFTLFAGPKNPHVLAAYRLGDWIYYGWFGGIAKVLSSMLHFFHDKLVGNYALAIIMLTVLVRALMFPLSRKAAKNAAMMQELAPEMKKIAEKYKNNMEARGKAQQELFRKYNYNPLSGCWMMFLQLPVFIGLYRSLAVDIELRQAPLIPGIDWASNLAGPDKLFYWKTGFLGFLTDETGWLGPYFNLLPIFTIALFLVHQKLFTPPATDEQTALQMKMMKIMTIFMGILFYKVPAGLCVYFIASSLWGIAERKLIPKPTPPKLTEAAGGKASGGKSAGGKSDGAKPFSFLSALAPKTDDNGTAPRKRPAKRPRKK